jgi:hypothetical protein
MSQRLKGMVIAGVVGLAPSVAVATEWAHESPVANGNCAYCHSLYNPSAASNFNSACTGCHNQRTAFGAPWTDTDEASPGVRGNNHSWSGPAESAAHGATASAMADSPRSMLVNGNLQCVVCHNPHVSEAEVDAKSMHTSVPIGEAKGETGTTAGAAGSATLTLAAVPEGTASTGFRVMIRSVDASGGTFIISHFPGGPEGTWLNWNGSGWAFISSTGPGRPYQNGVDVGLDVSGVTIRISAGAVAGDYWDFYVGYPLLRMTNVDDGACFNCHKERVMNHLRARGLDRYYLPNGVRKFSHPVGDGLNANGFGSDRARVLDADGTQVTDVEGKVGTSTSDADDGQANATNDLVLNAGKVRCTTCHRVHNADTNSFTRDAR